MSNPEQDIKKLVNVKKVIKTVKNIGEFALYSHSEDCNLVLTRYFVLNVSAEQFWEIQCGLLAKKIGIWYTVCKGEPIEGDAVEEDEAEIDMYFYHINRAKAEIIGYTDLVLGNIMLYAGESKYIGIKQSYIDMIGGLRPIKKEAGSSYVVASDYHLLCTADEVKCEYLQPILF